MKKRHLFPISLPDYNQNSIITALRTNIEIGNTDTYRAISNVIIDVLSNSGSLIITDDEIPEFFIPINSYPHPVYYNYFNETVFDPYVYFNPEPLVFTSRSTFYLRYVYKLTYNKGNNEIYTYNTNLLKFESIDLFERILLAFLNYEDLPSSLKNSSLEETWETISFQDYSWRKCNYEINNETKSIIITKMPPESIYFPALNCILQYYCSTRNERVFDTWYNMDDFFAYVSNLYGRVYFSYHFLYGAQFYWPYLTITYDQNLGNIENIFSVGIPVIIPAEDLVYHNGDFYFKVYPLKFIKETLQNGGKIIKIVVDKDNPEFITYKYFVAKILKKYGKKIATFIKQFIEIIGSWKYHHRWMPYTPTIFYENIETNYGDKFSYGSYLDVKNFVIFPVYKLYNTKFPNFIMRFAPVREAIYVKYNGLISDAFYNNIFHYLNCIFNYIRYFVRKNPITTLFYPYVEIWDDRILEGPPDSYFITERSHKFLPYVDC